MASMGVELLRLAAGEGSSYSRFPPLNPGPRFRFRVRLSHKSRRSVLLREADSNESF
jgi:hypothetical protein